MAKRKITDVSVQELDEIGRRAAREAIERLLVKGIVEVDETTGEIVRKEDHRHRKRDPREVYDREYDEIGSQAAHESITVKNEAGQIVEIRRDEHGNDIETPIDLKEKTPNDVGAKRKDTK